MYMSAAEAELICISKSLAHTANGKLRNMWRLIVEKCDLLMDDGEHPVRLSLQPSKESDLVNKGLVRLDALPKEWCQVVGMSRMQGDKASSKSVRIFLEKIIPALFI